MIRRRAFPLLLILWASALSAETLTLELDPAATTVEFTFNATLHTVKGSLHAKQGTVQLDSETGAASGWVVLDATSATTGNGRRDRKMHDKILESQRYPDIVFDLERVSGRLNRTGRSELQLHGTLEMHGTRRPVALPAIALSNGDRVTATGTLVVPYLEWGMKDPSFLFLRVAKEVKVTVRASGRLGG